MGITRARERLYLSRAIVRSAFGAPSTNPPSRFLDEVPPDLVDWRRSAPERSAPVGAVGFGRRGAGAHRPCARGATGSSPPVDARPTALHNSDHVFDDLISDDLIALYEQGPCALPPLS